MIYVDKNGYMRSRQKESLSPKAIELIEDIVSKTTEIKGCLLYNIENMIDEIKLNFDNILKWHVDRTGYEHSVNEIQLFADTIDASQLDVFAEELGMKLHEKFDVDIVINISYFENNDDIILENEEDDDSHLDWYDLRFFAYRESEYKLLFGSLNEFTLESVMCCIVRKNDALSY